MNQQLLVHPDSGAKNPPVSDEDYLRIHDVVAAILDGFGAQTLHACMHFATLGSVILRSVHGLEAKPVAGAACFRLKEDSEKKLMFGRIVNNRLESDLGAFHVWIEVSDWVVDLHAPLFDAMVRGDRLADSSSSRLFIRRRTQMASSPECSNGEGDFYLSPNAELTRFQLHDFTSRRLNQDLVKMCLAWMRPYPMPIASELTLTCSDGQIKTLRLSPKRTSAS